MAIKIYKPTSPGRRNSSVDSFADVTAKEPTKSLVVMLQKHSGRNNQGKITVRHRGGGAKRYYRLVDFRQEKFDMPATVVGIEYDPFRSARIAKVRYEDGEVCYILAPTDIHVGSIVLSSRKAITPNIGARMPIRYIPIGTLVHNIELSPGDGGKIVRGAGLVAKLLAVESGFGQIKLPSGEVRALAEDCAATIGTVSNPDHSLIRYGKAGRMRHRGRRPAVRGKAMNPVDHPHGGGEGHNPIGLKHPKTPWGKPALGVKTRKANKWSDKFILKRRNKK
ncbi:MAG: 50S ribosomal protein L2 [Patescibacteria group bacterium]